MSTCVLYFQNSVETELKILELNAPLLVVHVQIHNILHAICTAVTLCSLFLTMCILNVFELRVLKMKLVKKLVGRRKIYSRIIASDV